MSKRSDPDYGEFKDPDKSGHDKPLEGDEQPRRVERVENDAGGEPVDNP